MEVTLVYDYHFAYNTISIEAIGHNMLLKQNQVYGKTASKQPHTKKYYCNMIFE